MEYRIELSQRTKWDVEAAFEYIRMRAPENAVRWRRRLEGRLRAIQRSPEAFGFAPENRDAKTDVRQAIFGRYRILYTIRERVIFVLTIRNGTRLFLGGEEIDAIHY
jgi:plasmid stabilization system protein ParE